MLRFVRAALAGERVDGEFDTFTVSGSSWSRRRPSRRRSCWPRCARRCCALAGREADGAILNWLAPTDVAQCLDAIGNPDADGRRPDLRLPDRGRRLRPRVARAADLDLPDRARPTPRSTTGSGRGEALARDARAWAAGDRAGAAAAIPDAVVDELVVHGSPESLRERRCRAYVEAGVRTPVDRAAAHPGGHRRRRASGCRAPARAGGLRCGSTGTVVVVTGAGSGIGAALAGRFAAEGARAVVVTDRDGPAASTVAAELGGVTEAVPEGLDVTDRGAVHALVERIEARRGDRPVLLERRHRHRDRAG